MQNESKIKYLMCFSLGPQYRFYYGQIKETQEYYFHIKGSFVTFFIQPSSDRSKNLNTPDKLFTYLTFGTPEQ